MQQALLADARRPIRLERRAAVHLDALDWPRRAGDAAAQPLQPLAIVCFDAHRSVRASLPWGSASVSPPRPVSSSRTPGKPRRFLRCCPSMRCATPRVGVTNSGCAANSSCSGIGSGGVKLIEKQRHWQAEHQTRESEMEAAQGTLGDDKRIGLDWARGKPDWIDPVAKAPIRYSTCRDRSARSRGGPEQCSTRSSACALLKRLMFTISWIFAAQRIDHHERI